MAILIKNARFIQWPLRLLKYTAIFIASAVMLAVVILAALPTVVSTNWCHNFIQGELSGVLNRPVHIEQLDWSWKNGILINHVSVPDLPEFSSKPMLELDHVGLKIDVSRLLLHQKIRLELIVSGLNFQIIKTTEGKLSLNSLAPRQNEANIPPSPAATPSSKPFTLPMDVSVAIRLDQLNLVYDDKKTGKKYLVKNISFHVDAPSVKKSPISLSLYAAAGVNRHKIPRSSILLKIKNLFSDNGELNTNGFLAGLNAALPGITATVTADMKHSDINSKIRIIPASVIPAVTPLIPGFQGPSDINGTIVLTLHANADPNTPMAFDLHLNGSGLTVSGNIIDGRFLGPGDLSVYLKGSLDLNKESLQLASGNIALLKNSHIHVSGKVENFKHDIKDVDFCVDPLHIDLNELAAFVRPFIPHTVQLDDTPSKKAAIALNKLELTGQIPTGKTDVTMDGLHILLPDFRMVDKKNGKSVMSLSGGQINLDRLVAGLKDFFPASVAANLSLKMGQLTSGNGNNMISIAGLDLDHLTIDGINLAQSEKSKLKIAGSIRANDQLSIKTIKLPDLAEITNLEQSLSARVDLNPEGAIKGSLDHLSIHSPEITLHKKDLPPVSTDLAINFALNELFLKTLDPLTVDVKDFIGPINMDDALSLALTANAADTGNTSFDAGLTVRSDISELIKKIPSPVLSGISGSGHLNINVFAAGRRPDDKTIDALKHLKIENNLGFMDHVKLDITLDKGHLTLTRDNTHPVAIGDLTADPLLTYEFSGTDGKGTVNSQTTIDKITGIPGVHPEKPLLLRFSLTGVHTYADSIDLHERFSVSPAGIDQAMDVVVDGLGPVLARSPHPAPLMWISDMGGTVSVDVDIADCRTISAMGLSGLKDISLDGKVHAALAAQLNPGRSFDGGFSMAVDAMDLAIKNTLSAGSINADLDFSKSYRIQFSDGKNLPNDTSGLSKNVMKTVLTPIQRPAQNDISGISGHLRQIHERMNLTPSLSFLQAHVTSTPFPISIGESVVMLSLKNGLPNLDYFRFNLMGGTINGSILLLKKENNYAVKSALTFSGINMAKIFPKTFSRANSSDADISGLLYAQFPVTDRIESVLENADISLEFTRIGSRALERLLYALDPNENNETIVSQRRILKSGSPKQIRLNIKDGFLSFSGKVSVKGIDISLPSIRRLNVARVPGLDQYGKSLSGINAIISILDKLSADTIVIHKAHSSVSFK